MLQLKREGRDECVFALLDQKRRDECTAMSRKDGVLSYCTKNAAENVCSNELELAEEKGEKWRGMLSENICVSALELKENKENVCGCVHRTEEEKVVEYFSFAEEKEIYI